MEKLAIKTPKNRLAYLEDKEIRSPYKVIGEFFSSSWLPERLHMLKKWRNAVAFKDAGGKQFQPSALIYEHGQIMKLIEVAWLMRKTGAGRIDIKKYELAASKAFIEQEQQSIKNYPVHLEIREIIRPAGVLKKTFKHTKLTGYRKIMGTWLSEALAEHFFEDSLSKYEVIAIFENLVRLMEAMWLICERNRKKDL